MHMTKQQQQMVDPLWDFMELRVSYEWDDILKLIGDTRINVRNWLKVRDVMTFVNHELGYTRDNSDLSVERYTRF